MNTSSPSLLYVVVLLPKISVDDDETILTSLNVCSWLVPRLLLGAFKTSYIRPEAPNLFEADMQ